METKTFLIPSKTIPGDNHEVIVSDGGISCNCPRNGLYKMECSHIRQVKRMLGKIVWGEITKIDPLKKSNNDGEAYRRVYFKLENEKWAETDLVPTFRNWKRWKNLLKVGNRIDGLVVMEGDRIDADSYPTLLKLGEAGKEKTEEEKLKEMFKNGTLT